MPPEESVEDTPIQEDYADPEDAQGEYQDDEEGEAIDRLYDEETGEELDPDDYEFDEDKEEADDRGIGREALRDHDEDLDELLEEYLDENEGEDNDLEEGEEDEEGEYLPVEEDEEELGDEELERVIAREAELEGEEEDFGMPALDEMEDKEVADLTYTAKNFDQFHSVCRERGIKPDDHFVAGMARAGIDPQWMVDHEVYSLEGLKDTVDTLVEELDPNRIVLPLPEDTEGMIEFNEKHLGIPSSIDGYTDELFEGTPLEGDDPEMKDFMKKYMFEESLTTKQAKSLVEYEGLKREELARSIAEEDDVYAEKNTEQLKKIFGDDYEVVRRDVGRFVKRVAPKEFYDEFENQRLFYSSSFFMFLHNLMNEKMSVKNIDGREMRIRVQSLSKEKIQEKIDALVKRPDYQDTKRNGTPRERQRYRNLQNWHNLLYSELQRRNAV